MAWYQDQRERGIKPEGLPNVADLKLIAGTPNVTRPMLADLPLIDRDALMPYAAGVMSYWSDRMTNAP